MYETEIRIDADGSSMEGVYKDGKCREKEMGLQPVFCIFIADGHFIYGAGSTAGRIK